MVKRGNSEGNWEWNYNQPKQRNKHGRHGACLQVCQWRDLSVSLVTQVFMLSMLSCFWILWLDCMRANWEHQTATESLLSCCGCYHDSSHGIYATLFNCPALFVGENQCNSKAHPSDVFIEKSIIKLDNAFSKRNHKGCKRCIHWLRNVNPAELFV